MNCQCENPTSPDKTGQSIAANCYTISNPISFRDSLPFAAVIGLCHPLAFLQLRMFAVKVRGVLISTGKRKQLRLSIETP